MLAVRVPWVMPAVGGLISEYISYKKKFTIISKMLSFILCSCSEANLNGIYHFTPLNHNYIGIIWELWRGDYSLKKTRMMIRPRTRSAHNTTRHSQDYHEYTEDP